jgi:hypothetical protein
VSTAFDAAHYRQAYPDGYADHYWHIARDGIVLDALRARVPAGATCLEIGCGRGHFVPVLRGRGYDAHGVELGTPEVLREAAPYVRTGVSFADLPAAMRQGVSCVLLLDVIEHLADAPTFLAEVRASFPNLATLVVTVPARPEIWSNYDDHYGHFRRYTVRTLGDELRRGGFCVGDMRYAFRSLYLAALALRCLGAGRGVVHEAPRAGGLHRAIARALLIETRLLPRSLPGSSLVSVAEPAR